MKPLAVIQKKVLMQLVHSQTLKKIKPLRAFLRLSASGLINLLALLKGLRFPSEWGWYPKLEFLLGLYEPGTTALCKRLIKPGMCVVDIGANVGYYTILFSKLAGPNGKVFAFEPHPEIFQLLKHNVRKLKSVVVLQKAISNTKRGVEFYLSKRTTGSHSFYVPNEFVIGSCTVESLRLDDFLREEGLLDCDFIKIDVEGAEPLVIEGMSDLLSRSRKLLVIMELNPSALRLGGTDPCAFLKTLNEKFEGIYYIDESDGTLCPVEGTSLVESIPEWHAVNLLCCKGEVKL